MLIASQDAFTPRTCPVIRCCDMYGTSSVMTSFAYMKHVCEMHHVRHTAYHQSIFHTMPSIHVLTCVKPVAPGAISVLCCVRIHTHSVTAALCFVLFTTTRSTEGQHHHHHHHHASASWSLASASASPSDSQSFILRCILFCYVPQVDDFRGYIRDAIKKLMKVNDNDLDNNMPRVYVYDKYIPDRL